MKQDTVGGGGTSTHITDCKWMNQCFRISDVSDEGNEFVQKNILFFGMSRTMILKTSDDQATVCLIFLTASFPELQLSGLHHRRRARITALVQLVPVLLVPTPSAQ